MDKVRAGCQKVRIVSNNICYGPCPEPGTEVEQRLTVNAAGRIWFSAYHYAEGTKSLTLGRRFQGAIDGENARRLFSHVTAFFDAAIKIEPIVDIGHWTMTVFDAHGVCDRCTGGLCGGVRNGGVDLCEAFRAAIPIDSLWVFDTMDAPDGKDGGISEGNIITFKVFS